MHIWIHLEKKKNAMEATQIGFLKEPSVWFRCHCGGTIFQREGQKKTAPSGVQKGQRAHSMCWHGCRAQVFITSHFQWPCTVAVESHRSATRLSFLEWRALGWFCSVGDNISDKIFLASAFKLSRLLSVQSRLSFLWSHCITTSFVFHICQKLPTWKQFTGGKSR